MKSVCTSELAFATRLAKLVCFGLDNPFFAVLSKVAA